MNLKELKTKSSEQEVEKVIKDTIISLDKGKWEQFSSFNKEDKFWDSPYSDTLLNKDGASWFLECRIDGRYEVIRRWDRGDLSAKEVNDYLAPVINFVKDHIFLNSRRL